MSGDRLREAAQEVADELEFAGVARFDAGALAAQLREALAADERGGGEGCQMDDDLSWCWTHDVSVERLSCQAAAQPASRAAFTRDIVGPVADDDGAVTVEP